MIKNGTRIQTTKPFLSARNITINKSFGFTFESSIDTKKITEVIFHREKVEYLAKPLFLFDSLQNPGKSSGVFSF